MKVTRTRSIVKAITFRILGTASTILVFYFFTARVDLAIGAGFVDTIIKLVIYYFHERIWDKSNFGRLI